MWNKPWTIREGGVIGAGLLLTGEILQLTIGEVEWNLFAYPLNVLLAATFLAATVAAYALRRKVYLFQWLTTLNAAIPTMAWCALLTLALGLTSWMSMLRWWPLVLCYTFMMFILAMTSMKHLARFSLKELPFLLNHLGLLLALLAGTLGNADLQRLRMEVEVGKPEWRAVDETTGEPTEMEVAVELHSFTIDEYPAKLMLVDNETGKTVPAERPQQVVIEDSVTHGQLLDWEITADNYMEMAAQVSTNDTVKYVEWKNMGSATATHVTARNTKTGVVRDGWASCGSFMFPYHAMKLDDRHSLIMPDREPKRFASDVTVYTKEGEVREATIEVNKPLKVGGWKVYQLSYDESMGRWSNVSVFELVSDPCLPYVYAGIGMMLAGAVCMFATAGRRKEEKA